MKYASVLVFVLGATRRTGSSPACYSHRRYVQGVSNFRHFTTKMLFMYFFGPLGGGGGGEIFSLFLSS